MRISQLVPSLLLLPPVDAPMYWSSQLVFVPLYFSFILLCSMLGNAASNLANFTLHQISNDRASYFALTRVRLSVASVLRT